MESRHELNKNLAQMLKGGVIIGKGTCRYKKAGWRCQNVRS